MPNVWSTYDSETNESSNITRSATDMSERLQTIQRDDRRNESAVRTTQLIVDGEYAKSAAQFVDDAKSEIRLCAYAWRWYENEPEIDIQKLNVALLRAHMRGVKVRALVDTIATRDMLVALGFNCRSVINTRMLHTKAICVDDRTIIIGSHNMTKRATTDNYEMSIVSQEFQVVAGYIDYFDKLWSSRG